MVVGVAVLSGGVRAGQERFLMSNQPRMDQENEGLYICCLSEIHI